MSKPDQSSYLHRPQIMRRVLLDHSDLANTSVREINKHLEQARSYYPENLCVKSVYATIEGTDEWGNTFEAFARNGIPTATPDALKAFSAGNMLETAKGTHDQHLNVGIDYLKARPIEALIGCALLNEQMLKKNVATCLKGYNPKTGKFRQNSAKDCPNQQAGNCAERVLIAWLPYIYGLLEDNFQKSGIPKKYIIKEVKFNSKKVEEPTIIYKIDGEENWTEITVNHKIDAKDSQKETLYTEVLPCIHCAQAIVEHKIERVNMSALSRHRKSGYEELDGDDLSSIKILIDEGVISNFPAIRYTKTRPRK